jgi:hypothetical protein
MEAGGARNQNKHKPEEEEEREKIEAICKRKNNSKLQEPGY